MRVTILAIGSEGDVRPLAALGEGLARASHDVRLASPRTFRDIALALGLDFAPVDIDPFEIVRSALGQAWLASMDRPARFLAEVSRLAREVLSALNRDAWEACRGSEALIYNLPLSVSGYTIAESLGIPGIPAALYPLHPTRAFPSVLTPGLPLRGRAANMLSGLSVVQAFWMMFRYHQKRSWIPKPALPGIPVRNPMAAWRKSGVPLLYGYSPSFVPPPPDWPDTAAVCGYWFSPPREWEPARELVDFLEAGPAPLYVGFGSMAGADPEGTTRTVLGALRLTGQRAILASGWGGLLHGCLPEGVLPVSSVPHEWLFPRISVAVHHGGAGTTAAALRAGTPSVVVPFFADQFFWGGRLHALGLGPRPIPKKELSSETLAEAIRFALGAPGVRERCASMAESIRAENGVDTAAAVADRYLRSTTSRMRR